MPKLTAEEALLSDAGGWADAEVATGAILQISAVVDVLGSVEKDL